MKTPARVVLSSVALALLCAVVPPTRAGDANASGVSGQAAFNNNCRTCHSTKEGDNRLGPSLSNIVGAKAAARSGYANYSQAMRTAGITWDEQTLDRFIANPESVVPNKQCTLLKPTTVLDKVEEGGSGGKHFELVENADIMIETTHRSDAQKIYHRGFGQDEVAFQLSGRRATLTNQGEYMLDTGDFLLIPPGTSHRNIGDMATIRIILYTKKPVRLADEFIDRAKRAGQAIS